MAAILGFFVYLCRKNPYQNCSIHLKATMTQTDIDVKLMRPPFFASGSRTHLNPKIQSENKTLSPTASKKAAPKICQKT